MKKQKKNMGSLIKKAGVKGMAAGAVSLVLVAGGFHVLWEDYQRGNLFKPELFVKNRELQGNQIMFPEKENIQQNGNDPGENDNKNWSMTRRQRIPMVRKRKTKLPMNWPITRWKQIRKVPETFSQILPLIMQEAQAVQTGLPKDRV